MQKYEVFNVIYSPLRYILYTKFESKFVNELLPHQILFFNVDLELIPLDQYIINSYIFEKWNRILMITSAGEILFGLYILAERIELNMNKV